MSGARELGLLTSLALLAGELVLATETETHFPLETGIRFPLGLETNTRFPLETGICFPIRLETNTRFPLVLNVLVLSALLSAPFVLSPTTMTTLMTRQSFLGCIARSDNDKTMNAREGRVRLPRNNQNFMLSSAGCDDDCTAPHDNQRRKYAEVKYGEYTRDGMYIAKGMYVAKGKYIEYTKDVVYVPEGEYGKYAKEDASVKEGHNKPLAKEGDNEPLAKDGDWAGCNDEPLTTRAIGRVRHARQRQAPHHNR
jgi:hypothetical protein